ncbi:arylsulfatase [Alkalibacterium iburiense]|uniref:Arylsulfatase n=1 Tax=Alkalibacterium iburiense TaxID=290589 RepID=A0ABN0X2A8_9LACT
MSKKKPNIVLIFADDLGYGDVSSFNPNSKIQTKHIDRLADEGMQFRDSHATSSLCTPSRYGLLTGRYNWRSRLKSFVVTGDSEALVEKNRKTLPHMLKENGYRTAAVGKWHLGMDFEMLDEKDFDKFSLDKESFEVKGPQLGRNKQFDMTAVEAAKIEGLDIDYSKPIKYGPNDFGFDYFFGTTASLDQPPYVYVENNHFVDDPTILMGLPNVARHNPSQQEAWQMGPASPEFDVQKVPEDMQKKVIDLLDDMGEREEPFFLYYPTHLVHGPLLPTDEFKGRSGIGKYGDFVLQLDAYVGQIIDKLKEKDKFDETIFILTSDNGASPVADFEHLAKQGHHPNHIYKGEKADIWEGGHREPTIVSSPEMIKPGSVSNHMVSHSDIYRTVADILGVSVPDEAAEDSVSLVDLLKGSDEPVREDVVHSSGNGGLSIRRGFWKLNLVDNGGGFSEIDQTNFKPTELYDLREDISETNNVIDDYPDVVEELMERLAEHVKKGRSTEGKEQENERNNPTGEWPQINWMKDYDSYIQKFKKKQEDSEE